MKHLDIDTTGFTDYHCDRCCTVTGWCPSVPEDKRVCMNCSIPLIEGWDENGNPIPAKGENK